MPAISTELLDSVFYLYRTRADAEAGRDTGGTGFLFAVPLDPLPGFYYYAVTNWHVAIKGGFSVVRLNTADGGTDIIELEPHEWTFKPKWHDLAIADIAIDQRHKVSFVSSQFVVRQSELVKFDIGPGSDVFMIGRFIDFDGGATNAPSVRFGNISMMPQNVPQPTGADDVPSYVLDVHSRTGYSGSPVFVRHEQVRMDRGVLRIVGSSMVRFLGIHWGQFPEEWELKSDATEKTQYIKGLSGMTLAVPADAIMDLLETPTLKEPREKVMAELQQKHHPSQ